ncbi:hypothetical protein [Clostridioides sp. ZZV15-6597]|uniref:hypothetical protein n=1 Tax=Clostridioides sp. ZZV15-6597 TaxID=2811500 RepID=UPI001D11B67E|nr:hypothetical protein [Clostridioides sp. ZZV15-6597]HBF1820704.1 hypothetical protein [Clostridioides difficile]
MIVISLKEAFMWVFMLTMSVLLFTFVIESKPLMWKEIEKATQNSWSISTMNDGKDIDLELGKILEDTTDLTTK